MMQTIDDLFYIEYGQRELTSKENLKRGDTIIISSQGADNGCYGFFNFEPKYNPPFITVPRTGSIGEAFVQEFPCAVTDDLLVLQPKEEMEIEKLYFVATIIRQEKWRYNYGRKITPGRLRLLEIDFSKMNLERIRTFRKTLLKKIEKFEEKLEIKVSNYRRQKTTLNQLFDINYGQRELTSKENLKRGDTIIISSQGADNGCYGFFNFEPKYNPPFITVPRTGSIGEAFVQEFPCCVDDNCLVLSPKNGIKISLEEMYFVATLIRLNSWRYRYGRQITDKRLGDLEIDFSKFNYDKTKSLKDRIKSII